MSRAALFPIFMFLVVSVTVAAFAFFPRSTVKWRENVEVETVVYVCATLLASILIGAAARPLRWMPKLLCVALLAGVLIRFLGHVGSWSAGFSEPNSAEFWLTVSFYSASYLAMGGALVWTLVGKVTRATVLLALDAFASVFALGLLVWFAAVTPLLEAVPNDGIALVAFGRLIGDAALLALSGAMILNAGRTRFRIIACGAFAALLVGDIGSIVGLLHEKLWPFDAPVLVWALGFLLLGVATVVYRRDMSVLETRTHVPGNLLFWLGPLAPAVYLTVLTVMAYVSGELPAYLYPGGGVIIIYLALRASLVSYVNVRLVREREQAVVCEERARLAEDLHDTLKQEVHSVSLMLDLYRSLDSTSTESAKEILERASGAAKQASYHISTPIWELRTTSGTEVDAMVLLRQVMCDVDRCLPVNVTERFDASLDILCPDELAATYRILSEAIWNSAKHSDAENVTVSSRREGVYLVVEIEDDGRGLPETGEGRETGGMGLKLMRERAETAGAEFRLSSPPSGGTTIGLRFEKYGDSRLEREPEARSTA